MRSYLQILEFCTSASAFGIRAYSNWYQCSSAIIFSGYISMNGFPIFCVVCPRNQSWPLTSEVPIYRTIQKQMRPFLFTLNVLLLPFRHWIQNCVCSYLHIYVIHMFAMPSNPAAETNWPATSEYGRQSCLNHECMFFFKIKKVAIAIHVVFH